MIRSIIFMVSALVVVALCAPQTVNYVPMFDFDINLLRTDARLMAQHWENNEWVNINVTDDEWAVMQDDPNYRKNPNLDFYRQDSDEEGYDTFKNQILRAINNSDNFGSAYPFWKSHVLHGVPFFMITARSHFPASIHDGMETLLRTTLSNDEIEQLRNSFVEEGRRYGLRPDNGWWGESYASDRDNIIRNYLYACEFYAVSEVFWAFRHDCTKTELCKAVVVRSLVPYAVAFERAAKKRGENQISVMSFYDDTKENVVAVMSEMQDLAAVYPEICFRVFDTHDTKHATQYDVNDACKGIEPGQDWQAREFHSKLPNTDHVKMYL